MEQSAMEPSSSEAIAIMTGKDVAAGEFQSKQHHQIEQQHIRKEIWKIQSVLLRFGIFTTEELNDLLDNCNHHKEQQKKQQQQQQHGEGGGQKVPQSQSEIDCPKQDNLHHQGSLASLGDYFEFQCQILHQLFLGFCTPPPSMECIHHILKLELERVEFVRGDLVKGGHQVNPAQCMPHGGMYVKDVVAPQDQLSHSHHQQQSHQPQQLQHVNCEEYVDLLPKEPLIHIIHHPADPSKKRNGFKSLKSKNWSKNPPMRLSPIVAILQHSISPVTSAEFATSTSQTDNNYKNTTDCNNCLLSLPLEFQLSFLRILVRLLSEESHHEYEEMALFDFSNLQEYKLQLRTKMNGMDKGMGESNDNALSNDGANVSRGSEGQSEQSHADLLGEGAQGGQLQQTEMDSINSNSSSNESDEEDDYERRFSEEEDEDDDDEEDSDHPHHGPREPLSPSFRLGPSYLNTTPFGTLSRHSLSSQTPHASKGAANRQDATDISNGRFSEPAHSSGVNSTHATNSTTSAIPATIANTTNKPNNFTNSMTSNRSNMASWAPRKSLSLYSIIRFCSSPAWREIPKLPSPFTETTISSPVSGLDAVCANDTKTTRSVNVVNAANSANISEANSAIHSNNENDGSFDIIDSVIGTLDAPTDMNKDASDATSHSQTTWQNRQTWPVQYKKGRSSSLPESTSTTDDDGDFGDIHTPHSRRSSALEPREMRHKRWSFVADHVRLDEEEEEELRQMRCSGFGSERSNSGLSDDGVSEKNDDGFSEGKVILGGSNAVNATDGTVLANELADKMAKKIARLDGGDGNNSGKADKSSKLPKSPNAAQWTDRSNIIEGDVTGILLQLFQAILVQCLNCDCAAVTSKTVAAQRSLSGPSSPSVVSSPSSQSSPSWQYHGQYLTLGPVAHLIGLIASTGVSVKSLRKWIMLTESSGSGSGFGLGSGLEHTKNADDILVKMSDVCNLPVLHLARLHALRALRCAAEHAPLPLANCYGGYGTMDGSLGHGPQSFFSFGIGNVHGTTNGKRIKSLPSDLSGLIGGISSSYYSPFSTYSPFTSYSPFSPYFSPPYAPFGNQDPTSSHGMVGYFTSPWPFKHDFGMACWFRAETLGGFGDGNGGNDDESGNANNNSKNSNGGTTSVLFRVRTPEGASIEISLEACSSSASSASSSNTPLHGNATINNSNETNDRRISRSSTAATLVVSITDAYDPKVTPKLSNSSKKDKLHSSSFDPNSTPLPSSSFASLSRRSSAAAVTGMSGASDAMLPVRTIRKVRLNCPLLSTVWYHVAVRLSKPSSRLSGLGGIGAGLSRFSLTHFSHKDDVTIFLNGKLMLKEHLKMPHVPDGKSYNRSGSGIGGMGGFPFSPFGNPSSFTPTNININNSNNGDRQRHTVSDTTCGGSDGSTDTANTATLEVNYCCNFDGQAGALYVFQEHVSEDTIKALYYETGGRTSYANFGVGSNAIGVGGGGMGVGMADASAGGVNGTNKSATPANASITPNAANPSSSTNASNTHTINPNSPSFSLDLIPQESWDSHKGKLTQLTKAVCSSSMHAPLEDVVLPSHSVFMGHGSGLGIGGYANHSGHYHQHHHHHHHLQRKLSNTAPHSSSHASHLGILGKTHLFLDQVDEEEIINENLPQELSKSMFGSKLFLVWDPNRVAVRSFNDNGNIGNGGEGVTKTTIKSSSNMNNQPNRIKVAIVTDPHSKAHALLPPNITHWSFPLHSIKDALGSLGGISRLLPLFEILKELPVGLPWLAAVETCTSSTALAQPISTKSQVGVLSSATTVPIVPPGIIPFHASLLLPSLIHLLASFIRNHDINARELFRCGGICIVEKILWDRKRLEVGNLASAASFVSFGSGVGAASTAGMSSGASVASATTTTTSTTATTGTTATSAITGATGTTGTTATSFATSSTLGSKSGSVPSMSSVSYYGMGLSPAIAQHSITALLDLHRASFINFALETTVFSRLVFCPKLLLGGVGGVGGGGGNGGSGSSGDATTTSATATTATVTSSSTSTRTTATTAGAARPGALPAVPPGKVAGVHFHPLILQTWCEMAQRNPDKVRDCVDVKELLEVIGEYSSVSYGGSDGYRGNGSSGEKNSHASINSKPQASQPQEIFSRSPFNIANKTTGTNNCITTPLTNTERGFIIDVLFGIIAIMLAQRCQVQDLEPLIAFISYNLDLEFESASSTLKYTPQSNTNSNNYNSRTTRYQSSLKATSLLFFLLQKTPPVPNLMESLHELLNHSSTSDGGGSGGNGVASWMLCCMVNTFDDAIRGMGIKCLAAYLHATTVSSTIGKSGVNLDEGEELKDSGVAGAGGGATAKLSKTMKYVGTGFGVISHSANVLSNLLSGRFNVKVIYKLLWHLLKCHRERLGDASTSALMYLLVDEGSTVSSSVELSDILVSNNVFSTFDMPLQGFHLNYLGLDNLKESNARLDVATTLARQNIRNTYGVSTVLRLLRFLSNDQKERWLFDFLSLILASPKSVNVILSCDDWQPCLFQLVAEVVEEINGDKPEGKGNESNSTQSSKNQSNHSRGQDSPQANDVEGLTSNDFNSGLVNTQTLASPSVRTRYDLSLKLYSTLLGHCVRQGDEKAFEAVEMAASLQRVDANGSEVFSILLSHLFADLIEKGTVPYVETTYTNVESINVRNRALKQSARLVTQAILTNGTEGLDMASAVRQWRCLRHLTAVGVAVVTSNGFGVAELFDYQSSASAIDGITGGLYGIRLDNLVSGINAFEALAGRKLHMQQSGTDENKRPQSSQRERHRYVCVVLASQILTLLDAFIFPDNLDSEKAASQLHGLALVRSTEPRLGQSQGPLLASLVRLSLILLAYLEPSSVRFLQACSRLRCFLHWTLEIIRESVALGGYSAAFHELTAPLDRLVLAIVLQCHRTLSRCSAVLVEMESAPYQQYFNDIESRQKSHRRLFRAILELREIVLAAYRGRNEVLRAALSLQAHEALAQGLEEINSPKKQRQSSRGQSGASSKEANLRAFLQNDWVSGFHDVEVVQGNIVISEQVSNGQIYRNRTASTRGRQAVAELAAETSAIVKEYSVLLDSPFNAYCENQRKWAETDAVRDREYEGDTSVKRLSSKYRSDVVDSNKNVAAKFLLVVKRMIWILRLSRDPCKTLRHWRFPSFTDLLYRRILFAPNYTFDNHANASYELTLGIEREKRQREENLRKEKEREMTEALLRAGEAIVPYKESEDEVEDDDSVESDSSTKSFFGWDAEFAQGETGSQLDNDDHGDEKEEMKKDEDDAASVGSGSDKELEEWNQLEAADYEEHNTSDPFAWAKKFMWSEGEYFVHSFESVVIVCLQSTVEGTLFLTTHSIYFHQTEDVIDVMTKEKMEGDEHDGGQRQDRKWKLNCLTDIHGRRYMLKAQALELFFADMQGLFITFNGTKERDLFFTKIRSNCKTPLFRSPKSLNPKTVFKKTKLTELWRKRKISNFQYIMMLNLMAGRTFNDITQYPVFPWILADFTSEKLDLNDHKIYRDLSKPVGALNPDRLAQLIERFNDLDGFPEEEKFLYGSHYSSPGVVLHYLVRQEPFTSMHIALQSGRFDCPDRLFFDIEGCFQSCLTSTSDVKELTPEFFTCPEIFVNTNNFPLGETQGKIPIANVKLPPWAKGSPHEFIRIHRLALESEYVSQNLHHWIDLIFGYKQRGPAAAAAHNVFHYLSYEGSVDIDKISDEITRKATESHIQNFGQTPSQLITKDPHPSRSRHADEELLLSEVLGYQNLRCHTPAKQFGGPKSSDASGAILSLHSLGDLIFAIHSDLTLCSYKLYHTRGSVPFQFKNDRCREISRTDLITSNHASENEDNFSWSTSNVDNLGTREAVVGNGCFAMTLGGNSKVAGSGVNTADSSYLLMSCGYFDNSVKVHSVDSFQLRSNQNGGHRGRVNCIGVGEDGTAMVTGGDDATCRVWVIDHSSLAEAIIDGFVHSTLSAEPEESHESMLKCCHVLLGHVTPITCLAISTKLDVVLSGSSDGTICLHNIRSGRFIRSLHVDALSKVIKPSCAINGLAVSKLAIHTDGTFVAHLSDGTLHTMTINGNELAKVSLGENLNSMMICPKSETLITGGELGRVRIWKLWDLSLLCTVDVEKYGAITSLTLTPPENSPSGQFLCIGSVNGLVSIVFRGQ